MKPSILILLAVLCASQASARTWHILNDGSGDAPTVQAGIDSTAVGDTVLVGPGTYLENINFNGKDIVVKREMGPDMTILDGSNEIESVALFIGGETRSAVLEGFTLTGGSGHILAVASKRGGGIYILDSSPTIRGNAIVGNATDNATGGGILIGVLSVPSSDVSPLIEDNLIESNEAFLNGGGMHITAGEPHIRGNIFRDNKTFGDGGAICIWPFREGFAVIESNQFWDNLAADHCGWGVYHNYPGGSRNHSSIQSICS